MSLLENLKESLGTIKYYATDRSCLGFIGRCTLASLPILIDMSLWMAAGRNPEYATLAFCGVLPAAFLGMVIAQAE